MLSQDTTSSSEKDIESISLEMQLNQPLATKIIKIKDKDIKKTLKYSGSLVKVKKKPLLAIKDKQFSYQDICQENIGNCYLLTALSNLAFFNKNLINIGSVDN